MVKGRRKPRGELCALARDEMVIADVELPEGIGQGGRDARVAVPEPEDPAVAVTVDEAKSGVGVFKPDALPFSHDHLKAHLLVVRELIGRDVRSKNLEQIFDLAERLWG